MLDFRKRVDEIYPPEIFSMIIITIFSVIAFAFAYSLEVFVTPLTSLVVIIFLYTLKRTITIQLVRHKIFETIKISKKELYAFLVKRIHKERRKVRILNKKELETKEALINQFILDLKKDIIDLKGIVNER